MGMTPTEGHMAIHIGRREFIGTLGGMAAAWPLAAPAQQPAKVPTIGFLGSGTPAAQSQWAAAFLQRLRELGWIEGRNLTIEYRWAEGSSDRAADLAAEFVRLKVDVIVTCANPMVVATKQATSVIPIVFAAAADPLGTGLVAGLATWQQRDGPIGAEHRSCWQASGTFARPYSWSPPVGNHGQCRQFRFRTGDGPGSESGRLNRR